MAARPPRGDDDACHRAFHDALAESQQGRFAIVSSSRLSSRRPRAAYAATKGAAETWTLALADSFAGTGATAKTSSSSTRSSPGRCARRTRARSIRGSPRGVDRRRARLSLLGLGGADERPAPPNALHTRERGGGRRAPGPRGFASDNPLGVLPGDGRRSSTPTAATPAPTARTLDRALRRARARALRRRRRRVPGVQRDRGERARHRRADSALRGGHLRARGAHRHR